jgi:hypothetical protein
VSGKFDDTYIRGESVIGHIVEVVMYLHAYIPTCRYLIVKQFLSSRTRNARYGN